MSEEKRIITWLQLLKIVQDFPRGDMPLRDTWQSLELGEDNSQLKAESEGCRVALLKLSEERRELGIKVDNLEAALADAVKKLAEKEETIRDLLQGIETLKSKLQIAQELAREKEQGYKKVINDLMAEKLTAEKLSEERRAILEKHQFIDGFCPECCECATHNVNCALVRLARKEGE